MLARHGQLIMPAAVPPGRVHVPGAAHPEGQQRLQLHGLRLASPAEGERRALAATQPRRPVDVVPRARVRDRQRCLMHGVVVERCQHLFSSVLAYQHCRLQLKVQARVKGLASCRPRTYGKQYQTNSV
jgi:hypothetical protein